MSCDTFRWVGQPPTSCDNCGEPYWHHQYRHTLGTPGGPFAPITVDRVPITPDDATAVKTKWAPEGNT